MNTALKVVGTIALVAVAAVIMLIFAGRFLARNIHVQETGKEGQKTVHVDSPFGQLTVHENDQLDPEQVGIPIYPEAVRSKNRGGADFQFSAGDLRKDVTIAGATYYTGDDPDKVREFYRSKFPSWNIKLKDNEYHMETKGDGRMRSIIIKRENGQTRIEVASVGQPASN